MKKNSENYFIGLDIGTNSVGWAVLKEDFSLMKKGGKHMWGSRLFEDANTAADTRALRQSRRRYERRKERIRLLQMLLEETILKTDPGFFKRLERSFLLHKDKDEVFGRDNLYNLFDGAYTDKDYYKEYKTIYHLRKKLCESTQKADIRLIYLALHHIIKYRGNFLHEEDFSDTANGAQQTLSEFLNKFNNEVFVNEDGEIYDFLDGVTVESVCAVLSETKTKKSQKFAVLKNLWKGRTYAKKADEFAKALLGYKANFATLFACEIPEDKNKADYTFSFAESAYEEKALKLPELFDAEIVDLINLLHAAYQDLIIRYIIGEGNQYISEGMIALYEKHAKDLKILKAVLRPHKELYKNMFKLKKRESYTGYVKNDRQSKKRVTDYTHLSQDDFYKAVKSALSEAADGEDKKYILEEIENGTFLPKINSVKNAAIPYQLNLKELKAIIENQSKFYPELEKNADKIISILTFRRPYSVGVIVDKTRSRFSWVEEGMVENERIYPWNFEEKVDIDAASENFIKKMTSRCRFFPDEHVLPLNSVIYQKYIVLNELNKIRIIDNERGERGLTVEEKKAVFNGLFLTKSTVSAEAVRIFLFKTFGVQSQKGAVIGLSDKDEGNKFTGKMSTYIKLEKELTPAQFADLDLVEKIVENLTVFSDPKIRRRVLTKLSLDEATVNKLVKTNFAGWGRFSKKLLVETKNQNGESILDIMYETNKNFNEIIFSEELGFKEQLFNKQSERTAPNFSAVKELYLSPAVKRGVWQSLKIVNEIVKITGCEPKGIYVESTRKDDKKTRTRTRADKLKALYDSVEKDVFFNANAAEKVKNIENEKLNDDMIYLYLLQMGKSMYSGKSLGDVATLSLRCEIDHIVPQCYIKDDSIENRVLVLKEENQEKSGSLTLKKAVRENMKPFWDYLFKNNLMGKKKYFALSRAVFTDSEKQKFISRQLVETNQSAKAVRDLFKAIFTASDVELIKAGISSEFRTAHVKEGYLSFIKLRELNDMHHAKDAYLACAIARFTRKIYPIWGANDEARILKDEIEALTSGEDITALVNRRNGIVVDAMRYGKVETITLSSGEKLDWNSCYNNVLKAFEFNDCLVTKHTEITAESAFYNGTIYGVNDKKGKGNISLRYAVTASGEKKELPPERYGKYSAEKCAYFVNVTYKSKNKIEAELFGVPVLVTYKARKDENAVTEYFGKLLSGSGKTLVSVDKQKILRFQPITFNGHYCYIASDSYLWSAVQLVVDKKFYPLLYAIAHPEKPFDFGIGKKRLIADREYFEPIMKEFVLYHCEKVKKLYPLYKKLAEKTEEYVLSGAFDRLGYFDGEKRVDKAQFISYLLNLTRAGSTQLDMKKFGGPTGWGALSGKTVKRDSVTWHYQSVTGLFEKTVRPV